MRSRHPALFVLVASAVATLALSACAGLRPPSSKEKDAKERYPVGVRTLDVVDEARERKLTTEVWYPATAPSVERDQGYFYAFRAGRAAREAEVRPGRWPLVLLSHGSGGTRFDLAWLAEHLAASGFVVAASTHPGNSYDDNDPYASLRIWERPGDVSVVIDHVLADTQLAPFIDEKRIGAAGHSLGGYTVLATAGARYDVHRARAHCARNGHRDPICTLAPNVDRSRIDYGPSADSYKDPRIKSVIAFAPAVGPGFDPKSAADVEIPVHIIAGGADQLTPFDLHARTWATLLRAELTVLGLADHYAFVSACKPFIKLWPWADACRDPTDVDRSELQRRLAPLAEGFFRKTL